MHIKRPKLSLEYATMLHEKVKSASKLIAYSDMGKRLLDIFLSMSMLPVLFLPMLLVGLVVAICEGRPILYASTRMKSVESSFTMWKFRTMRTCDGQCKTPGGETLRRVTPCGRWLRTCRLDELPQLWNILKGDMSFVGPRPPLPEHVSACPETYKDILKTKPGVTGLASLVFHRHESTIMRRCSSVSETEAVYLRRCIPRKARLDRIYRQNQSFQMDLWIIWKTFGFLLKLLSIRKGILDLTNFLGYRPSNGDLKSVEM